MHFVKTEAKRWSLREYDSSDEAISLVFHEFLHIFDRYLSHNIITQWNK